MEQTATLLQLKLVFDTCCILCIVGTAANLKSEAKQMLKNSFK